MKLTQIAKNLAFFHFFILSFFHFSAQAQIGEPWIHDPSTLAECDGKWFTFGTGGGGLISEDGYHWHSGGVRPGGGAAPDVVKIGDRYLVIYGATGGGLGGRHNGRILTMWNNSLDPESEDFRYTEAQEVVISEGNEDNDAIDPGLLLDPTTGRLWVSYGTYFGNIRLIELDPKTGLRVDGNFPKDIGIDCEATDLLYRDGWYYLLGTHGTCCDGVNSTYNIVVGRAREVTGPYLDNVGRDMMAGGGRMVLAAEKGKTGAGHFGRTILDEGVEVMSCHYEADYDRGGRSVLDIRPLLWRDGWPKGGERFRPGNYWIESERRGYALELTVDFVRQQQERAHWFNDAPKELPVIEYQKLAEVQAGWPQGEIAVRAGDYMFRPHQQWTIEAVDSVGYLGQPYYKISIEGTDRVLSVSEQCEVVTDQKFSGEGTQLWRIDQCTDGTYRILPKRMPGDPQDNTKYVLYSLGDSMVGLEKWDFQSDNSKWNLRK